MTARQRFASNPARRQFRFEDRRLSVYLDIAPHASAQLALLIEPIFDGVRYDAPEPSFRDDASRLGRIRNEIRDSVTEITTSNVTVARAWETAIGDLASLPLGMSSGPAAPLAGIPRFQEPFGRDMLTTGWQAGMATPLLLRDALRLVAETQGTQTNDFYDEQPGKMLHQASDSPLAVLGIDPYARNYGDYATAPDYLIMIAQYLAWTNDMDTVRDLLPAARRTLEWLEHEADLDGDGFIEYVTRSPLGLKNQGWKDHYNAIVDEDGNITPNPVATCELQAWWYTGLLWMSAVFARAGDLRYAAALWLRARDLKRRFNETYWMEDLGYYALALDPDKRQVRSIASNALHLLATGIVPPDKGRRVIQRAMKPDMFSGWGIRTLSSNHPAFNPFGYHVGSVWPVENAVFAFGFARYGCIDELHQLTEAFFATTELFAESRLPEDLGGIARDELHPHPGVYPKSSSPQAWSASAVVLAVQALLGLRALAPLKLLLVDPQLPTWLSEISLHGIKVGDAEVDLCFRRDRGGRSHCRVLRREGTVRVLRQPVPQGPHASPGARMGAALASLPWS